MALILDHVNGVADDNRLENLRIVCPNCAATLDTHCGRNLKLTRACAACGTIFKFPAKHQRHCSRACGGRSDASLDAALAMRRVERPPYWQLLKEVNEAGYLTVGRKYGVSDNAIRKWIRQYERAATIRDGAALNLMNNATLFGFTEPELTGHENLPIGGHRNSPLTATGSPHGWPSDLPTVSS